MSYLCGVMYTTKRENKPFLEGLINKVSAYPVSEGAKSVKAIFKDFDFSNKDNIKHLLELMPVDKIIQDRRIYNIVAVRVKNRQHTQEFKSYSNNVLALIHSGALISKELFNSIGQLPSSPLRGLSSLQISVLIGAWLHQQLNERVFTAHNLIAWGSNLRESREAIYLLVRLGYVQKLDYNEVFKYSKKLQGNRNRGYYILTKEGERALKVYFKLFAKRLEKITGQSWDVPLLKIIKEEE